MARKKKTDENKASNDEEQGLTPEPSNSTSPVGDEEQATPAEDAANGDENALAADEGSASGDTDEAEQRAATDSEAGSQGTPSSDEGSDEDQSSGSGATASAESAFPTSQPENDQPSDGTTATRMASSHPDQNKEPNETGTTLQGADVEDGDAAFDDASDRPLRTAPFTQSIEAQNPRTRQEDHMARASERRKAATEQRNEEAQNEGPQ